jgi:Zn-dependent peptidase ImmA (M78 family)/DNA-binding XRE family transcriptional regulator
MIVLARESRGMTQAELADKLNIVAATLSKMESGDLGISDDMRTAISNATGYPVSFFEQKAEVYPEHLVYRKRDKVAQKLLTPINAKINIQRLHVQFLIKQLDITKKPVPVYEVGDTQTPQIIAQKVREQWNITEPVIDNLIALLEERGIVVTSFDFGTERVDSRCILTEDNNPMVIYNKTLLGDRQRFSLAFQLGHLVMHTGQNVDWERDVAHEANLFASEFLMPEQFIRKDFDNGITLALLGGLKSKWKVSMISLLYRADDLGYVSANQKKYLIQQFNEQKMRRREPKELDVPVEEEGIIKNWLKEYKSCNKINDEQVAASLCLRIDEYKELYS